MQNRADSGPQFSDAVAPAKEGVDEDALSYGSRRQARRAHQELALF
jgi:hypothetical protein